MAPVAMGETMLDRNTIRIGTVALAATLMASLSGARAFDDAQYPDLSGQWIAVRLPVGGQPAFDPTKPWGLGQEAPLTPEYQKVLEASVADQAGGGQGNWHTGADCLPSGMPGMMTAFQAMEIIVLPETTYVRIDHAHDSHRRIYTDGRDWPDAVEPSPRSRSRPAISGARGRSIRPACRPTRTTSPSSRSVSSSISRTPGCCTTRSP
jgi:hypothetical protein